MTLWKSPFFKINYSNWTLIYLRKPDSFQKQIIAKIPSVLTLCTQGIRLASLVQYGQLHDPIKNTYFRVSKLNIRISQNFCMKTQLFPGASYSKSLFCSAVYIQGVTTYHVWFNLNNSMAKSKNTILIIRNYLFEIIAKFCLKTWFFLEASYSRNSFCSRLYLHRGYCTSSSVQFGPLFDSLKNSFFKN